MVAGDQKRRNRLLTPFELSQTNRIFDKDRSIHEWYRFVLSFPPHLVRNYINKFNLSPDKCILDPFAGTGTTLVEAKKHGIGSIGIEANPVAHMVSTAKISWDINLEEFINCAYFICDKAKFKYDEESDKISFSSELVRLLIKNSISPVPLYKSLALIDTILRYSKLEYLDLYRTAFAKTLVFKSSNLKFGPEVGVKRNKITDCNVFDDWFEQIKIMKSDLDRYKYLSSTFSKIILGDSRNFQSEIKQKSIDAVICSPPYPNEKDYTRTTRLELVLLRFINSKIDLKHFKHSLIRSNTRNIYKDDNDDIWINNYGSVTGLSKRIENERLRLGKTSGFERLYHRVVSLYFGGLTCHLERLKPLLKQGAKLAYVVGDQASYFRIPIRTGEILEEIANNLGYTVLGRELFRTRFATASKEKLREEVLILQWKK